MTIERLTSCPTCGKSQGWNGHAYAPCAATPADLLEAFNYGTRTERTGSETGLDRISRRYRGDLYAAACDGYSLSAQFVDPKPYRDAIRAGEWSRDLYDTVGGN